MPWRKQETPSCKKVGYGKKSEPLQETLDKVQMLDSICFITYDEHTSILALPSFGGCNMKQVDAKTPMFN